MKKMVILGRSLAVVIVSLLIFSYTNCSKKLSRPFEQTNSSQIESDVGEAGSGLALIGPNDPRSVFEGERLVGTSAIALKTRYSVDSEQTVEYQWFRNDISLPGATEDTYVITLESASVDDSASFHLEARTQDGTMRSRKANFIVRPIPASQELPNITQHPYSDDDVALLQTGDTLSLMVMSESATSQSFAWFHDGVAIPGSNLSASSSNLVIDDIQVSHAGSYYVQVTNEAGFVTSESVTIVVTKNCVFDAPGVSLGQLLEIKNGQAQGWALNPTDICNPITIEVWSDENNNGGIDFTSGTDTLIESTLADAIRADVPSPYTLVARDHGFNVDIPSKHFGKKIFVFSYVNGVRRPLITESSSATSITAKTFNSYGGLKCPSGFTSSLSGWAIMCQKSVIAIAQWTQLDLSGGSEYCNFMVTEKFTGGCGNIANRRVLSNSAIRYAACKTAGTSIIQNHYARRSCNSVTYKNVVWATLPSTDKNFNFSGPQYAGKVNLTLIGVPISK